MREGRQEHKEYRRIHKIDVLVHPGYLHNAVALGELGKAENFDLTVLYNAYLEQAKQLSEHEILFAIAPTTSARLRTDFRKQDPRDEYNYASLLTDLKTILGDRLVVLSDDYKFAARDIRGVSQHGTQAALEVIRKILHARGMEFDRHTALDVYGEFMFGCVTKVATRLNKAGDFCQPSRIRALLTEYITRWGETEVDARADAAIEVEHDDGIRYSFENDRS